MKLRNLLALATLLLGLCNGVAQNNQYVAKVVFTANPFDGGSLTVNGSTFTFKTTVVTPSTQILIGGSAAATAANLLQHFKDYPVTGISPTTDQTSATTIYLVADSWNVAITTSVVGAWGTANVTVTSLVLYTAQLPLSAVQPLTHRTNLANWMIIGMRDYATTNFPAGAALLVNYVDTSTSQTYGNKRITNSTVAASSLTNSTVKTLLVPFVNNAESGIEFFSNGGARVSTIAPDANGLPSLFGTLLNPIPTNGFGAFAPNPENILIRAAGDTRYGIIGSANTWTASTNTFSGRVIALYLQGIVTNASGGFTNVYTTNLYVLGSVRITNNNPSIWIQDANAAADQKNTEITAYNGELTINAWDDAGGVVNMIMGVTRSGANVSEVAFPSGVLVPDKMRVVSGLYVMPTAGFGGIIGVGSTNPVVPASMTKGLIITDGVAPAANPTTATAIWSEAGEPKYRNSAGGAKFFDNVSAVSVGSGTDYHMTTTYAQATFGSSVTLPLPSAGTYLVQGSVTAEGETSANDAISVKLYNATDAADITGSERTISSLPAGARASVPLNSIVTVGSAKTIHLYAKNATASRGYIVALQTSLSYVRLN